LIALLLRTYFLFTLSGKKCQNLLFHLLSSLDPWRFVYPPLVVFSSSIVVVFFFPPCIVRNPPFGSTAESPDRCNCFRLPTPIAFLIPPSTSCWRNTFVWELFSVPSRILSSEEEEGPVNLHFSDPFSAPHPDFFFSRNALHFWPEFLTRCASSEGSPHLTGPLMPLTIFPSLLRGCRSVVFQLPPFFFYFLSFLRRTGHFEIVVFSALPSGKPGSDLIQSLGLWEGALSTPLPPPRHPSLLTCEKFVI